MDHYYARRFTDLAWKLLGRYITNNTHLDTIKFDNCGLTNEKMTLLFGELVSSSSCRTLSLRDGAFDASGLRNMVPFLGNSPELRTLLMDSCRSLDTECFELLIQALHYSRVESLHLESCNIKSVSALDTYNLPNLQILFLNDNNIGREGCKTLSNLLQKESTTLKELYLMNTGMGDYEAEVFADSLKHNTQLRTLCLYNNDITEKGYILFFKLVSDVSSIETIYKCNHTLSECLLSRTKDKNINMLTLQNWIDACLNDDNEPSCRTKVINFMLNSTKRKDICKLQGIENPINIFTEIEPVTLLPNIIALIGNEHGQSELYTSLKSTAPELLSYIDRKAMIQETIKTNTARKSALADEYSQRVIEYERRMAEYEAAHKKRMATLKTDFLDETTRLTVHNNELNNRLKMVDSSSRNEGECNECEETRISGKKRPLS